MKHVDSFYVEAERLYSSLQVGEVISCEDLMDGMIQLLQERGHEVLGSYVHASMRAGTNVMGFIMDFCGRHVSLRKEFNSKQFGKDLWRLIDHRLEDFGEMDRVYDINDVYDLATPFTRNMKFVLDRKLVAYCPLEKRHDEDGWPISLLLSFLNGDYWEDREDPYSRVMIIGTERCLIV